MYDVLTFETVLIGIFLLQGWPFAGLQYSKECFCGNYYNRYGAADNCNMECGGDDTQTCGGGYANQVYRVGRNARQGEYFIMNILIR